ncbi:hypothetical protein ES708_22254 [subsurface metagenome]
MGEVAWGVQVVPDGGAGDQVFEEKVVGGGLAKLKLLGDVGGVPFPDVATEDGLSALDPDDGAATGLVVGPVHEEVACVVGFGCDGEVVVGGGGLETGEDPPFAEGGHGG